MVHEALDAAAREPFDIIFMDVQLPEMDGFDATRSIAGWRRRPAPHHHRRHDAHAMAGDRERCLASGMDGYLSKPLDRAALTAVLDRAAQASVFTVLRPGLSGRLPRARPSYSGRSRCRARQYSVYRRHPRMSDEAGAPLVRQRRAVTPQPGQFSSRIWRLVACAAALVIVFALYAQSEEKIHHANELRDGSRKLADELRQSSDDLTRMARTYVVTGDPIYKRHYQDILDIRDGTQPRPEAYSRVYWDLVLAGGSAPRPESNQAIPLLELMRQAGFTEEEFRKLAKAKANSDGLTTAEFEAMKLTESTGPEAEADRAEARRMLHDASLPSGEGCHHGADRRVRCAGGQAHPRCGEGHHRHRCNLSPHIYRVRPRGDVVALAPLRGVACHSRRVGRPGPRAY
jgi:hypothetical protein